MLTPLLALLLLPGQPSFRPNFFSPELGVPPSFVIPAKVEPDRKATLVVKGKDFHIDALTIDRKGTVACTAVDSGAMTILMQESELRSTRREVDNEGHSVRDVDCSGKTVLAGVLADGARVYLLTCQTSTKKLAGSGLPQEPFSRVSKYQLIYFRAANGEKLHTLNISEGDFPPKPSESTTGKGPLTLRENGVACYGVVFEFTDEMVTQRYEKKKD